MVVSGKRSAWTVEIVAMRQQSNNSNLKGFTDGTVVTVSFNLSQDLEVC